MKQHLYVAQLSDEPGQDIAWCTWLVLAHDEDLMGSPKDDTWRRVDKILAEVPIRLIDEETDDYKPLEDLIAEITPALEAKGFEVVGSGRVVFPNIVG